MGRIQRHLPAWSRGRAGRVGFAGAMGISQQPSALLNPTAFSVGYSGALNIENEDPFCGPSYVQGQTNFTEQFKRRFHVAHEFLETLIPPLRA